MIPHWIFYKRIAEERLWQELLASHEFLPIQSLSWIIHFLWRLTAVNGGCLEVCQSIKRPHEAMQEYSNHCCFIAALNLSLMEREVFQQGWILPENCLLVGTHQFSFGNINLPRSAMYMLSLYNTSPWLKVISVFVKKRKRKKKWLEKEWVNARLSLVVVNVSGRFLHTTKLIPAFQKTHLKDVELLKCRRTGLAYVAVHSCHFG